MGPSSTQVCMDYSDCPQDKDVEVSMEGGLLADRKGKPHPEQALKCPRCDSANTKFCYYNNYSLSQPRYFCKTCRRYWTKGGTLRNVPVGGGCRKNKRPKRSSEETSCASAASASDHTSNEITGLMEKDNNNNIPSISGSIYYGNDINMPFARFQEAGRLGADESAFKSSGAPDFLGMGYDGVGVHSMKSGGFPGMDFLKSLRNEHGDVNCLLEPQLQLSEAGGLPNFAPLAGLNSLMYPETYWRCHEQEQKVEPIVKEVSTEQLLLNFGEQTAENSRRQPKPEVFTGFGFSHGVEKEWQEQLEATRNSIYWNNGGAGTGTVWPFYGSSSVSPLN